MIVASQSLTGRALKNLDRTQLSVPMINDPSSAFLAMYDGHHKSMAVNHVHAKLLTSVSAAQKKGLEVRLAVPHGMQQCDQQYLSSPTVFTDDRFGSGTGALVVMLQMGTLYTCNLGTPS